MTLHRASRAHAVAKVLVDRLCAAVALVVLSPIIATTALGIRLSMEAPVVFRQARAGRDGVPFTILKFRTMEMRAASCCGRPEACRGIQMAPGATISRFARFVRRTGLDELPQLINILRGEMSFHHCRMIHGSDVNRGDRPRTSIALHLQDGKNRYRPFLNARGEPWQITNDDLCRKDANGHPDYSDPAAFPVLWSADGAR